MAITWKKSIRNPDPEVKWPPTIMVDDGVSHVGCVLGSSFTKCVRVMSDIYSDEYYCHVIDPVTLQIDTVHLGGAFECNTRWGHATPDVSDEIKARLAEKRVASAEVERVARLKAAEEARVKAEEDARKAPTKGRIVSVVRGRKVAKGTTGWVFWARDGRVGLALSDKRDPTTGRLSDVAWVDAVYCAALPEKNTEDEVKARLDADRKSYDDFKAAQQAAAAKQPAPQRTYTSNKAPF